MINAQIPFLTGGAPQAGVLVFGLAELSTYWPVLVGVSLLTVIVGLVLWRQSRKTALEAEQMQQSAAGPAWDGTVGEEERLVRMETQQVAHAKTVEGGVKPPLQAQAGERNVEGLPHAEVTDPGLARLLVGLGVTAQHGLVAAGEGHNDEEELGGALVKAAAAGPAEVQADEEDGFGPPMVEAVAVEEAVEVEATPVEELPMVEAAAEEVMMVEAVAAKTPSEVVETETAAKGVGEIPVVAAEPVDLDEVEAAPAEQSVEVAAALVEAAAGEQAPVEDAAAPAEEMQEEAVPVVSAEPVAEETTRPVEFAVEPVAVEAAAAEAGAASAVEAQAMEEDGQTTFFTFEDLNFQPVEDAKPGEDGLGLSLEEAAAVLASGPVEVAREEKKEEAMPRIEQLFPALVNDEGPAVEAAEAAPAASEPEAHVATSPAKATTKPVGRGSRLKRITLGVPVLVRGPKANPGKMREVTQTLVVLPQGAVVSMGENIGLGEELNLVNLKTGDEVDCRVVGMKLGDDGKNNVEIEFLQEATSFWPVSFPADVQRGRGRETQMEQVRS